jgi:hypothetical protein
MPGKIERIQVQNRTTSILGLVRLLHTRDDCEIASSHEISIAHP